MTGKELVGKTVKNSMYGVGKVQSCDEAGRIVVDFAGKICKYQCQKAFADGFLTAEDSEIQEKLISDAMRIAQTQAEEKERKRIMEQEEKERNRKERQSHKDVLFKGERFRTHADALNECFGFDYKHYQKAFKNIDDKYAVWFPSIARRVMGEYLAADTGNGWMNILCENDSVILEKNVEDVNMNRERDRSWDVFVFCKMDGEDDYTFVGLFRSNPVPTENGFRYERLGTQIDLNKMQVIK